MNRRLAVMVLGVSLLVSVQNVVLAQTPALAQGSVSPSTASPSTVSSSTEPEEPRHESPWILVPKVSSDPKVGTSAGVIAGYMFKADPQSTASVIGAMGTYSTTDSWIGGVFFRGYWDDDSKRLTAGIASGQIRNDYEDFLGSGLPAQTTDEMKLFFARYLQEFYPDWYIGGQGIYTNYLIASDDFNAQKIMQASGLTGVDSGALGLALMYDTRNSQNAASSGIKFNINNFAFREAFGGEDNFDTLHIEFDQYLPHGDGHVLAWRAFGRATDDAPPSGYSSVDLRGYTRGQYLAPNSFALEVEQRWHVHGRFGINAFAGVACLFGDGRNCGDSDNLYPSVGIGGQYLLKEEENIVITVDYAKGKEDNDGFYVRLGQAF